MNVYNNVTSLNNIITSLYDSQRVNHALCTISSIISLFEFTIDVVLHTRALVSNKTKNTKI